MAQRVNAILSDGLYEALTELSRSTGKSMSDVLRDAIGLEKWFQDTRKEGGRILVERGGSVREVILR